MDAKLVYGKRNGKIVSIDEVENGLKCKCTCPNCNKVLIARKGGLRSHHFAHYDKTNCNWLGESIIHKRAKEIISESKTFKLPPLRWSKKPEINIYPSRDVIIKEIKLEKRLNNIIPDIILKTENNEDFLIEIYFTNKTNYSKLKKIEKINIPTIEIDVSKIAFTSFEEKDYFLKKQNFKESLVNNIENKTWIFHPERLKINSILKSNYSNRLIINKITKFEYSLIFVDECPISKRKWKSGYKEGKGYAKHEDCLKCKYYFGEDFLFAKGQNTGIEVGLGNAIYCIGHMSDNRYDLKLAIAINKEKTNNKSLT